MRNKHLNFLAFLCLTLTLVVQKASAQYYILPKAADGSCTKWSYLAASLDDGITAGYETASFDDSSWDTGRSGFGISAYRKDWANTIYSGSQGLWIRKTINLNVQNISSLKFELCYDEDPVIYVNGTKVYEATGWNDGSYRNITSAIEKSAFNLQGENVIAIHFVPGGGGSCLDFSISCSEAVPDLGTKIRLMEDVAFVTPFDVNYHNVEHIIGSERGNLTTTGQIEKLTEAIEAAKVVNADANATTEQVNSVWKAMDDAYDICKAQSSPIVDGYYYIHATFDGRPMSYETRNGVNYAAKSDWKDPETNLEISHIFYITKVGNNAYTVKNIKSGEYLGPYSETSFGGSGSFEMSSAPYTTYIVPWKQTHNYSEGTSYGYYGNAVAFALYSEADMQHEYSGRWANTNIQSDLTDKVAHSWRVQLLDGASINNLLNDRANDVLGTITPANHHDNTGTRSFLLGNEKTSADGLATSTDALAKLQDALNTLNTALSSGKTLSENPEVVSAFESALDDVNKKSNPLVDGFYYLIAEYGNDTDNVPGGWAMRYSGSNKTLGKAHYDATDTKQIFKVTYDSENGKIALQNVASGLYVGVINGNVWNFTSENTTLGVMSGVNHNWYHNKDYTKAARSCSFILYDTETTKGICNTGTTSNIYDKVTETSRQAWEFSWAFRPVADEVLNRTPQILNINNGIATTNTDEPVGTALITAALANDDYTYTSIDLSNVELESSVTVSDIAAMQSGNMIVAVPASSDITGKNIVNDGVCASLELDDGNVFSAPTGFTATSAIYTRSNVTNAWGTICLPYEVKSDDNATYYTNGVIKTEGEESVLTLTKAETIPAGTPAIVKFAKTGNIEISADNAPVVAAVQEETDKSDAITLVGSFTKTVFDDVSTEPLNYYYVSNNKFWQATKKLTINPFRAYFTAAASAGANGFSIAVNDDDLTAISALAGEGETTIEAIYTLDGKQVSDLQQGVNIVRLSNGKTQKIVIR